MDNGILKSSRIANILNIFTPLFLKFILDGGVYSGVDVS
jgi:hypothetical protein